PNNGQYGQPLEIHVPEAFSDVVPRRLEPFGEIDKSIWENLWAHLILSGREFMEYRGIADRAERWRWIFERGAIKEAVCLWVRRQNQRALYPTDVEVYIENGAIRVDGLWSGEIAVPNVTMSYLDRKTVSAVGSCKLGIEIESVESNGGDEWTTRAT